LNCQRFTKARMIVILMGVTGVGKTTVGKLLAASLGCEFYDADDFHSAENVAKMRAGTPLQDADRWPWLDRLNALLREVAVQGKDAVLACSALKERYRERLARGVQDVRLVWLKGSAQLIRSRLESRRGHYMNPALLDSQIATLEPPTAALAVDIDAAPQLLAERIERALGPGAPPTTSSTRE
jgi:gluconokinase